MNRYVKNSFSHIGFSNIGIGCSSKVINIPEYGKCIISQGNGNDQIKLWINQNLNISSSI